MLSTGNFTGDIGVRMAAKILDIISFRYQNLNGTRRALAH